MIDVCIPTFNRPEMFRRCLQNLSDQTIDKEEMRILIGDNGGGYAGKTSAEFHDLNTVVYRHGRNIGCVDNFFFLYGKVKGDYVFVMPDDEIIYPEFLKTALMNMEEDVAAYYTSYDVMDAQGVKVREGVPMLTLMGDKKRRDWSMEEIIAMSLINTFIFTPCCLHRADAFLEVVAWIDDAMIQKYQSSGEKIFYILIREKGRIIYEDLKLAGSIQHGNRISDGVKKEDLRESSRWVLKYANRIGFDVLKYWHEKLMDTPACGNYFRNFFLAVMTDEEFDNLRDGMYNNITFE
jgi:glycosyltransferase involved in cell wall biosynthesis